MQSQVSSAYHFSYVGAIKASACGDPLNSGKFPNLHTQHKVGEIGKTSLTGVN